MPQWVQVLFVFSPWILGFIASIIFTISLFYNDEWLKRLKTKAGILFNGLPVLLKIPIYLVMAPICQGFFIGLLFGYVFFCPDEAAVL